MSTDQQWAGGGGRMGYQHEQMHERRVPIHQRMLPFAALYVMSFLIWPALEMICWTWGHFVPTAREELAYGWLGTASILAFVALGIGTLVARRTPFVVWHVIVTIFFACFAAGITTLIGLFATGWQVSHFFGSVIIPSTWALYRIDSLRAIAQGPTKDAWGELIGLARSRPRKVSVDENSLRAVIEHGPGETKQDVEHAAKKLESATGALTGRTTVQSGERSDTSVLTLQLADPFAHWRWFPGLSHPGGSFALPLRTGYYADGDEEWFSFVPSLPSPLTKFRSEQATFLGSAGTTGSGKSGGMSNEVAEVLSRCDVVPCWADAEKFFQNAGWCADMLGMAAKTKPQTRQMTAALRKLAEFRVEKFGQAQLDAIMDPDAPQIGREWTPELAREMGEPAVVVLVDEADTVIRTQAWEWLGARGRSLGIFLHAGLPRASTQEVSAVLRGSIATWKTYRIGDKYSDDFTLSQDTKDAGANPQSLTAPGLHYLDLAPGVDPRKYPVLARDYQSTPQLLRKLVRDARENFTPMTFSPESIAAMGDDYQACRPEVVMGTMSPEDATATAEQAHQEELQAAETQALTAAPAGSNLIRNTLLAVLSGEVAATDEEKEEARRILTANGVPLPGDDTRPMRQSATARSTIAETDDNDEDYEDDEGEEEEPMMKTATGTLPDDDEVSVTDPALLMDPETAREMAGIDPHKPIDTRTSGLGITLPSADGKPRWTPEDTENELDRVLRHFADINKMEFPNADVIAEMQCAFSEATASRRLDALAEGSRLTPPGLGVERLGRGRFRLIRKAPRPHA